VAQNCESAVSARVQEDVRRIVQSLHTGDIDVVLKYTHPKIVKLLGGQAAAGQALESAVALLKKNDMKLESLSFPSAPTCLAGGGRRFVIVPTLSMIAARNQRIESLNFQFGVLESGAADWTYVEGSRVNAETVQLLFPGFPREFQFPQVYRKRI
jgi:hypothetical protein